MNSLNDISTPLRCLNTLSALHNQSNLHNKPPFTLVNVHVDLLVFTRIAGTS